MNFLSLNYFLNVVRDKNISRAAEHLNISQQALSSSIQKLEKELGVTLLDRNNGLALTFAGERVAKLADEICLKQQQIIDEAADIAGNKRSKLRIGISYICGHAVLPKILPEYMEAHPLVDIEIIEGNFSTLEELLAKNKIDIMIGFTTRKIVGAESIMLRQEHLVLAIPQRFTSTLPKNDLDFNINCLSNCPFILLKSGNLVRNLIDNYMIRYDFKPNIIIETDNSETSAALAATGMGITAFSEFYLTNIYENYVSSPETPLRFVHIFDELTCCELALTRMHREYIGKDERDFVDICIDKLRLRNSI